MWSRLAVSGAGRVPQLCVASPVGPSLGREGWWELCGEGCLLACLALGCGRSSQQERLDLGHHAHCGATPASPGMVSLPSVSSVFGWTQPGLPPVATQAQAEDGGGGGSRPSGHLSARLCSPSSGLKPLEPHRGGGSSVYDFSGVRSWRSFLCCVPPSAPNRLIPFPRPFE